MYIKKKFSSLWIFRIWTMHVDTSNPFLVITRQMGYMWRSPRPGNSFVLIRWNFISTTRRFSLHLFKRGSSCRAVVGRNRKTLFARESPHSFCLRRGRSAARVTHTPGCRLLRHERLSRERYTTKKERTRSLLKPTRAARPTSREVTPKKKRDTWDR